MGREEVADARKGGSRKEGGEYGGGKWLPLPGESGTRKDGEDGDAGRLAMNFLP